MQKNRSSFLDDLVRALRWRRRPLAALAAALSVLCGLLALQPADGAGIPVVTAARDLPGGTVLAESDLQVVRLPPEAAPAAALTDIGSAVGRSINTPVTRLSVITEATVSSGQSLARPGFVVAAVPLADAALATLLRPGARIDVIGQTSDKAGVLASDVRVVALPAPAEELGGLAGGRVALVEVTAAVAARLAAAGQAGEVSVAVR